VADKNTTTNDSRGRRLQRTVARASSLWTYCVARASSLCTKPIDAETRGDKNRKGESIAGVGAAIDQAP